MADFSVEIDGATTPEREPEFRVRPRIRHVSFDALRQTP
jgi:hypothetical protein